MRNGRWIIVKALLGFSLLFGAGCSNGSGGKPAADNKDIISNEPLTLSFLQTSAQMTDEEFNKWVVEPVRKKYPNITITLVRQDTIDKLPEFVAAGNMPDIIYAGPVSARKIVEIKAAENLNDLVKKHNVDPGKFDPVGMEVVRQLSDGGSELYALPMALNFSVLFYNKDLFDKFAVSYPKDGMTWDEAIELAKRLTRSENGVQYRGLAINGNANRLGEQLSLPMIDPKTLKPVLQTDQWKLALETYKKLYFDIPGNYIDNPQVIPAFESERTLAMMAGLSARIGELEQLHNQGKPMNWDMATAPTFPIAPKNVFGNTVFYLMVSSLSKHKEEAFRIVDLLTQDEEQMMLSRQGRRSGLKDPKFQVAFGQDLNSLKGKNVLAAFKTTPVPVPPVTIYEDIAFNELVAAGRQVAQGKVDVNTALREAEERILKKIEEQKK